MIQAVHFIYRLIDDRIHKIIKEFRIDKLDGKGKQNQPMGKVNVFF